MVAPRKHAHLPGVSARARKKAELGPSCPCVPRLGQALNATGDAVCRGGVDGQSHIASLPRAPPMP